MIEQSSLVKVHRLSRGVPGKQVPCQLEHVISVAGLGAGCSELLREMLDREEVLAVAVTADHKGMMTSHTLPEERGNVVLAFLARDFVFTRRPHRLGDLRVGMQSAEPILSTSQRIEYGFMIELPRQPQVFRISSNRIEICEDFVHATKLGVERSLLLLLADVVHAKLHPVGKF